MCGSISPIIDLSRAAVISPSLAEAAKAALLGLWSFPGLAQLPLVPL